MALPPRLLDPGWPPAARHEEVEAGAMSPQTGFHGDDSDSNILKIFRMLDRTAADQYHYYQPGIGTYVVSGSLSHTGIRARINSWYSKAKDSAVGSSFDQHVVGGYRFLMRFYSPGDEIYMFGFSRGAYIARFLAEMLDHIGLLSHGNEEMVKFAWKAFAQWQSRRGQQSSEEEEGVEGGDGACKAHALHDYIKGFRETFSRPVGRIRFLGLFDTVNSVPRVGGGIMTAIIIIIIIIGIFIIFISMLDTCWSRCVGASTGEEDEDPWPRLNHLRTNSRRRDGGQPLASAMPPTDHAPLDLRC
ncbi:hypothetical protein CDD80_2611 [Ophiocordyceps camponoti-rufipedis]|uniref:T6SS Phospholipase effector Tle1-like catalytic domain-containing protein n=1 Tax=Ophiocordyceps camponoti-rufipedis TaxID=2004952 RepID=A0A2C5Z7G7_9HYPO|nr:hypothetical protein CDD80_2611 [Ophiocordyceps camponoti-rufipedis]